ncbi:uncharacterized protein AB675_6452 [Cyphellophora attinorum]|uniref:Uncharacterized protein n=1 Tax=Cyphellophora attinorum TaxID=1664694 RepID=A0A0N1P2P7_9EURO|nr:uncharacterized protein AB675_6452 [Phialophora attinorum]KPI43873.1 hypothetical protein AB675_6452 [Phialophora attinorum]
MADRKPLLKTEESSVGSVDTANSPSASNSSLRPSGPKKSDSKTGQTKITTPAPEGPHLNGSDVPNTTVAEAPQAGDWMDSKYTILIVYHVQLMYLAWLFVQARNNPAAAETAWKCAGMVIIGWTYRFLKAHTRDPRILYPLVFVNTLCWLIIVGELRWPNRVAGRNVAPFCATA